MRIADYFEKTAVFNPEAEFAVCEDTRITYGEAHKLVHAIATALSREDSLSPGAHIGIYSQNTHWVPIVQLGINRADMAWMGVHDRNSVATNAQVIDFMDCELVFFNSRFAEEVAQLSSKLTKVKRWICIDKPTGLGDNLMDWLEGNYEVFSYKTADLMQTACIVPTGGTTGPSKGAVHSHYGLEQQMLGLCKAFYMEAGSRLLSIAPLSHAAGQYALGFYPHGGTNVVLSAFDPEHVLTTIEAERITHTFLPPTLVYMLLAHPDVKTTDFSSLKVLLVGAAPFAPEKFKEAVRAFGPVLYEAYAQSETLIPVTVKRPEDYIRSDGSFNEEVLRSAGKAAEFVRVEILDDDGNIVPRGEKGEICVRASMTMKGYHRNEEATAEAALFGFHHSGDIGVMDEHDNITIVDRKKDMIVSGAFNVFPAEVEKIICEHAAVLDCIVVGVPDEKWGEAVTAVIQLKKDRTADAEEIRKLCHDRLGGVKTPKSIEFWDELPRSPVGKLLRRVVRDKFWDGHWRSV